tara:strand:+ start:2889 stop:3542 length:654 start_codon:yes stop_codon:yes gene_type:complete
MEFLEFNLPNLNIIVLKLFFLSITGLVIRQTLVITGQRWANTFHHLGSYILLPCIALIITTVIKNDIALSLGMIGALSIVRFRNPVKSPFELVIFFALLTLGIVCSVSGKLAILLFIFIVSILYFIKFFHILGKKFNMNLYQFSFGEGNLVYTLELNSKKNFPEFETDKNLIQMFQDQENSNYFYRFAFINKEELNNFKRKIESQKEILNIKTDYQA